MVPKRKWKEIHISKPFYYYPEMPFSPKQGLSTFLWSKNLLLKWKRTNLRFLILLFFEGGGVTTFRLKTPKSSGTIDVL